MPLIVKEKSEENPIETIAKHYSKILLEKMLEKPEKPETIKPEKENTNSSDAEKVKIYEEVDINCVLAYHLINNIYNKLKKVDIHYSWEHILKCLNKQVRITTSMTNKDSDIINIRNCSEPTDFQNEIYSALKIKNIPLPKAVLKRKK